MANIGSRILGLCYLHIYLILSTLLGGVNLLLQVYFYRYTGIFETKLSYFIHETGGGL